MLCNFDVHDVKAGGAVGGARELEDVASAEEIDPVLEGLGEGVGGGSHDVPSAGSAEEAQGIFRLECGRALKAVEGRFVDLHAEDGDAGGVGIPHDIVPAVDALLVEAGGDDEESAAAGDGLEPADGQSGCVPEAEAGRAGGLRTIDAMERGGVEDADDALMECGLLWIEGVGEADDGAVDGEELDGVARGEEVRGEGGEGGVERVEDLLLVSGGVEDDGEGERVVAFDAHLGGVEGGAGVDAEDELVGGDVGQRGEGGTDDEGGDLDEVGVDVEDVGGGLLRGGWEGGEEGRGGEEAQACGGKCARLGRSWPAGRHGGSIADTRWGGIITIQRAFDGMETVMGVTRRLALSVGLIFSGLTAAAQPAVTAPPTAAQVQQREMAAFFKSHYAKHEYRIAMRDGVKLFTAVYTPVVKEFKDAGPYPFLMSRTPYSCAPYGEDKVAPRVTGNAELLHSGYILVCQDVRGRWGSEGKWLEMTPSTDGKGIDESSDTYDTVEWLLKHVAGNNGRVGILGISYPGFYTAASIVDGHPAIKAASPQAPVTDLWMGDDAYHGGAMMLNANHEFYAGFFGPQKNPTTAAVKSDFSFGTKDAYAYYLKMGTLAALDTPKGGTNEYFHDQVVHTTYDDYWKARNIAAHMHGVKAATMEVGGWFDAEDLSGPVKVFHAIDSLSPGTPANVLVEGPWVHGGWARGDGAALGDVQFGSETAKFYREQIEFPFFEKYLKDAKTEALPKAYTFETGSNVWKKYAAWPPKNAAAKMLYLQPGGGLAWSAPVAKASKDEYVSDPAHPVPFTEYTTDTIPQRYMADDQRFAGRRSDVLVYETEPLTEDVTVAGPVRPKLKIASTGTDADFVVKLIDVYPEDFKSAEEAQGKRVLGGVPVFLQGYEQLVRGEPMRAKFRNSWEKPEALVPGKMTEVDFTMQDVNHTFLKGHRIMVQVQSSWFPLVDRNPQVFEDIYKAKAEDFRKATETVFHQAGAASGVELMVLK
jgi:putative CocE/NonD family hydrolase